MIGPIGNGAFKVLDLLNVSGSMTVDQIIERTGVTPRVITRASSDGLVHMIDRLEPIDGQPGRERQPGIWAITPKGEAQLERALDLLLWRAQQQSRSGKI